MELECIDGNPVVNHVVRFRDRVNISETDAQSVRDGAVIVWLVRTRCEPPSYHPTRRDSDDRYRFNIQKVEEAVVLHDDLRDGALAYFDDPTQNQGRLIFESPRYAGEPLPLPAPNGNGERHITVDDLRRELDQQDDESVEVLGSVYRGPSETRRLMAEMWDDLP